MADFRRIVSAAVVAALVAGLWLSVARQIWVVPLILQAEESERKGPEHATHDGHGTPPDGSAERIAAAMEPEWTPAEGLQRNGLTWIANGITAFGFALLLVAGYVLARRPVTPLRGVVWGLAAFAVFSLAPAFGLPPALPGTPEGPVVARQLWWLLTVACSGGGLWLLAFGRHPWRWLGLALLAVPHAVGAPHVAEDLPYALIGITHRFIAVTLAVNAIGFLLLGGVSAWMWGRKGRAASAS